MKTPSLIAFGALILIGWTTLAGGVIAVFAGDSAASRKPHLHQERVVPHVEEAPLMSDAPDAAVPYPV